MFSVSGDFSNPDFLEFYKKVADELRILGYNERFILCYKYEIYEYFEKNISVEEAVSKIA